MQMISETLHGAGKKDIPEAYSLRDVLIDHSRCQLWSEASGAHGHTDPLISVHLGPPVVSPGCAQTV